VAQHAGNELHNILSETKEFKEKKYPDALIESYLLFDEALRKDPELKDDPAGTTAVSCLVTTKKIYVANAGDSRCVICCKGTAVDLSTDHKPVLPSESERIKLAGGFVEFGRVNGMKG
jgi:protein phosphatase 2C family protein 2/3